MGEHLPSGTVTMLFSDIEGSTLLLTRLGDQYAEALDAHRAMLRSAWSNHGGTEMGTEGDSFFVVFETASQALNAALQAQRALSEYRWPDDAAVRVRMGVHTGSPAVHDGSYVGMDVHRAARIAGSAHGGQVVVSEATARLATGSLPDRVRLIDKGAHRLKDLALPERLFQLAGPGLHESFPPLKTLGAASSLPVPATPLVGRERELTELTTLLGSPEVRLVTLTGPGGSGKTRLAVSVAQRLIDAFPDGVYFVDLAAATTDQAMWTGIAETLGVPAEQRTPPGLFAQLAQRTALVVLDNLEQLPVADTVVAELLVQAPGVAVIATSRSPLHLAGEHEHPVPPLSLPTDQALEGLRRSGAVELFVQHVARVRRGFALTADNANAVVEICRRLDGLPLALELAAARAKLLSPHALLRRLDGALELRAPGIVDRPARHHTLRDTIAWSYRLLKSGERAFLRRLSVFAGGADLDAVTAVTDDLLPAAGDPLDPIGDLLDASLVTVTDTADGEPRLQILETIRAYAREQLAVCGELEATQDRHATYYQSLGVQLFEQLHGPQYLSARTQVDLEVDNFRAAIVWGLQQLEAGGRTAQHAAAALQTTYDCTIIVKAAGGFSEMSGWLERAVDLASQADSPELSRCLALLADTLAFQGSLGRAFDVASRAVEVGRRTNETRAEWLGLLTLSIAHCEQGEHSLARLRMEEAVSLARSFGRGRPLIITLMDQSDMEYREGNLERAIDLLVEAHDIAQNQGAHYDLVFVRIGLAELRWRNEGTPITRRQIFGLIDDVLTLREPLLIIMQAEMCAALLASVDPAQAARLLGAAEAERDRTGFVRFFSEQDPLDKDMEPAKRTMTGDEWGHQYQYGRTISIEHALSEASAAVSQF